MVSLNMYFNMTSVIAIVLPVKGNGLPAVEDVVQGQVEIAVELQSGGLFIGRKANDPIESIRSAFFQIEIDQGRVFCKENFRCPGLFRKIDSAHGQGGSVQFGS